MRWLLCAVVMCGSGAGAGARAADPELHAVGFYEGFAPPRAPGALRPPGAPRGPREPGTAKIVVDRPNAEVVLALTAYDPIEWTVTVTPKTKLTKVLVGGYHEQRVTVPQGIEVEMLTYEAARKRRVRVARDVLPHVYDLDGAQFRPFVRELFAHTKLPLSSFTGAARPAEDAAIAVNALQKDDRLSADFPQLSPKAQIPKFAFEGTRFVPHERFPFPRALFGDFSEAGPSKEAMPALPERVNQTAYDAGAKVRYGIDGLDLYVVDIEKRTAKKVAPVGVKPSWLTAITFDAKRGRVLIAAVSAFYEYVPKTGAWTELQKREREREPTAALAWCKATDTLYAVRGERQPNSEVYKLVLVELAANGAEVKRTPLGPLVFPGLLYQLERLGGSAQLVDLGKQLALLVHTHDHEGNDRNLKVESFLYVIDPATGGAKLAWKE